MIAGEVGNLYRAGFENTDYLGFGLNGRHEIAFAIPQGDSTELVEV